MQLKLTEGDSTVLSFASSAIDKGYNSRKKLCFDANI